MSPAPGRPKAGEPLLGGGAQRLGAPGSRIDAVFATLKAQGRKALIPFITAGDPYPDLMVELMAALADAGADVIELGVPFSDPMADGPVIQKASDRALARGVGLADVLGYVRSFRQRNDHTPVVLMGYANPIERYEQHRGANQFAVDARAAGVDGVLVVDYPPEECVDFAAVLCEQGIAPIFLLAPTSTDARMEAVGTLARGYVYYVSLKGVTGAGHLDTAQVAAMVPRIRAHVPVPVGVGFGIRDAATAKAIGEVADGVVIGSRLVQLLETQTRDNLCRAGAAFIAEMRAALDTTRSPA